VINTTADSVVVDKSVKYLKAESHQTNIARLEDCFQVFTQQERVSKEEGSRQGHIAFHISQGGARVGHIAFIVSQGVSRRCHIAFIISQGRSRLGNVTFIVSQGRSRVGHIASIVSQGGSGVGHNSLYYQSEWVKTVSYSLSETLNMEGGRGLCVANRTN